jgi:hypothetical protein
MWFIPTREAKANICPNLKSNNLNKNNMKTELNFNWTRIDNDTNGNPRYVIHFLDLLTEAEKQEYNPKAYEIALVRAKKIGGKKFHNKQYGGGIVFQSYNIQQEEREIINLIK